MTIYQKDNPETIQELFDSIAPQYDRANSVISFGLHTFWNNTFWNRVIQNEFPSPLLDLCCGTGETALPYLRKVEAAIQLYLLDFSPQMLRVAEKKIVEWKLDRHHIHSLVADAQKIPLRAEAVRYVLLAYGIRNIADPKSCLREIYRVLQPGGRLGILELTRPKNRFLQWGHLFYLRFILPLLGRWVTKNGDAYRYLSKSIAQFVEPEELADEIEEAGFDPVEIYPLSGGMATIWIAEKR